MKITKRQLRRIIREAVINETLPPHLKKHFNKDGSAKVHNPMGYEIKDVTPAGYGPDESYVGPTVPNYMMDRIDAIRRGDLQDHLYDIVDAIESGDPDYTMQTLKLNLQDAEKMDRQ